MKTLVIGSVVAVCLTLAIRYHTALAVYVFYIQWDVRDFLAGMLQAVAQRIAP